MANSDGQDPSGLRVSGYRPRIRQTAIVLVLLVAIVAAIALAAIWANSRDPEQGVPPTPRPTQPPEPTATLTPVHTPTPEPEEVEVQVADTATPTPTNTPTPEPKRATDTPTPETRQESPTDTPTPMDTATATSVPPTPNPTSTNTPLPEPTAAPTAAPTATSVPPSPTATSVPPTAVPTPTPAATPTATPIPAPSVPTKLEIYARGTLIDRGIEQSGIEVLNVEKHTWLDRTLGCGTYEQSNPAEPIDGWVLTLGNEDAAYTFHVAEVQSTSGSEELEYLYYDCTDVENREQLTINLVHDLRLHEARRAVLYRGSADVEEKPVQDIQDRALVDVIVEALNMPIPIGNSATCETAFRLDFYVSRGIETIRFFCRDDWYRVGGDQEIWGGTQGAIPKALLDAVSPYFAAVPIPQLPTLDPEE